MSASAEEGADRRALLALWLIGVIATVTIWRHPSQLAGAYDWRYFQSAMEAARRSLAWFGQLPLYNPYMCGGEPQLANPQSIAGSPAFLLVAIFGTAIGERLMLVLFVCLGLDGTFRLARTLGLDRVGAFGAALVFGLSGWVVQHFAIGHVSFYGATLLPHALFFYLRAKDDLRYCIGLGAASAVIVAQGGTSTAAMAALALGAVGIVDAITERRLRPIGVLCLGALAAVAFGAYRLLPALEFAIDHPRRVTESDAQTPVELLRNAFRWGGTGKLGGHRYGLHEYAWRLPYLAWPLVFLGAATAAVRRSAWILVVLGVGIALGDAIPYGPWWLMRKLPVLRDLRVPSRYVLLSALGLALLAGAGISRLRARAPRLLLAALVAALAVDGLVYADARMWTVFDLPSPPVGRTAFHQTKGHWSRMLDGVFANQGVIGCDEEAPLTRALALDEGPVPQARLEDPEAGRIYALTVTPNLVIVDVSVKQPTELLVDLNWNEHFKANVGEVVRHGPKWPADKDGGRLAVRLPAGDARVVVRYLPSSFVVGAIISIASLLALVVLSLRRRGARAARSAA